MGILDELIAQPTAALCIFLISWLLSVFILRLLLGDLLKMHKSSTAMKKIGKQYTFRQKLCLRHVAEHTEHAVNFTCFLIGLHHLSVWTMLGCLLSGLVLSEPWFVRLLVGRFLIFDCPVFVLDFLLEAHPFNRAKRRREIKNRRRFFKYHNTSDKTSLF